MGLETAAIVTATIAVGAEVGKAAFQIAGASSKREALDLQAKQLQLETQQKTLQNYDLMEKTLDAQAAHMTTTGLAFSSPSYNAIERNTINIGAKRQKNIDIEGEVSQQNIKTEKENVNNTLYAELFGDVAQVAGSAFSVASKMPTMSGG